MSKITKPKRKAQNSARKTTKRQQGGPGKPFAKGNPWRFPKGQSGNPGGRPRVLRDAYSAWLKLEGEDGLTNAMRVAQTIGTCAAQGDTNAAKEIRMATEGATINTWQSEVIALLRDGKVTAQDVIDELGNDAQELLIAAGILPDENGTPAGQGEQTNGASDTSA